jgi:hypothetical protein
MNGAHGPITFIHPWDNLVQRTVALKPLNPVWVLIDHTEWATYGGSIRDRPGPRRSKAAKPSGIPIAQVALKQYVSLVRWN